MPRLNKTLKLSELTLPKDYDMRRDGISQSLLSIFPLCRLKFLLKVNRWRAKNSDIFVSFGNISHDVLEWVYKRGRFPTRTVLRNLVDKACEKMEDRLSAEALRNLPMEANKVEVVLWEYFKHYRSDFKKFKFVELERTFIVDFHGFKLMGKKDGVINDTSDCLLEHKTKSQIKEELLQAVLNFDFQNLFYITAHETETGKKLHRVLYNIIRNPQMRQKQGEDVKEFLDRITKDIKSRPEFYFVRYPVTYLPQDKEIYRKELVHKLEEAEAFLKGLLPLYRNQQACEVPYRCEFLAACGSGNLNGYEQGTTLFPELDLEVKGAIQGNTGTKKSKNKIKKKLAK